MQHRRNAGYSLSEVLVVISIIGVLSLITVPVFMNFQRQSVFKGAMRTIATDLRSARNTSIKSGDDIRIEFTTGAEGTTTKRYEVFSSSDGGTTWTPMNVRQAFTTAIDDGTGETFKLLQGPAWFELATNLPDIGDNGRPDIVFHPNGTVDLSANATQGVLVLATNWTDIYSNRYNIWLTRAGQVKALPCQCMDGVDNDGDGTADKNGVDTNKDGTKELDADGQCVSGMDNDEAA